ncbi:hypothetical protein F5X68DRAFT_216777 [Plectosphaerella plurivora]|uniref:Uncharacterized protein n=1 Tax=Plectosphaerella plurivora TaxID=936078 RepID=A0A9P9A474_9PEZI|nr:hypothetical protein F5X68DRAFT_216777 [Plectosphaerella plurivora]
MRSPCVAVATKPDEKTNLGKKNSEAEGDDTKLHAELLHAGSRGDGSSGLLGGLLGGGGRLDDLGGGGDLRGRGSGGDRSVLGGHDLGGGGGLNGHNLALVGEDGDGLARSGQELADLDRGEVGDAGDSNSIGRAMAIVGQDSLGGTGENNHLAESVHLEEVEVGNVVWGRRQEERGV